MEKLETVFKLINVYEKENGLEVTKFQPVEEYFMGSCKNCKYMEFIYHPNGEIDEKQHFCYKKGKMNEDKPCEEHVKINYNMNK